MTEETAAMSGSSPTATKGAASLGATAVRTRNAPTIITVPSNARRVRMKPPPAPSGGLPTPRKTPTPSAAKKTRGRPRGSTSKPKTEHDARIASVLATPDTASSAPTNSGVASERASASASTKRANPRKRKAELSPADVAPRKKRAGRPAKLQLAKPPDVPDESQWLPPKLGATRKIPNELDDLPMDKGVQPRIWAANKSDLYAVLPELFGTKPTGTPISNAVDYMPVIVLDDESVQMSVDQAHPLCAELSISRKFGYQPASALHNPTFASPDVFPAVAASNVPPSHVAEAKHLAASTDAMEVDKNAGSNLADAAINRGKRVDDLPSAVFDESMGIILEPLKTMEDVALFVMKDEDYVDSAVALDGTNNRKPSRDGSPRSASEIPIPLPCISDSIPPFVFEPQFPPSSLQLMTSPSLVDSPPVDPVPALVSATPSSVDPTPPSVGSAPPFVEPSSSSRIPRPEIQIPDGCPPDIAALLEAWKHQYPVLLVASRASLASTWHVRVPEEYEYSFLGLFRITVAEEQLVRGSTGAPVTNVDLKGRVTAEMRWRTTLRWSGGGENFLDRDDDLSCPWWAPSRTPQLPTPAATPPTSVCRLTTTSVPPPSVQAQILPLNDAGDGGEPPSGSMAAAARTFYTYLPPTAIADFPVDQDIAMSDAPSLVKQEGDLYSSALADDVASSQRAVDALATTPTSCISDYNFPLGWCCRRCGRLNMQLSMRRRACSSQTCVAWVAELQTAGQEELEEGEIDEGASSRATASSALVGYALRIDEVRDPRDTLPLVLPLSVYPNTVRALMAEAEDGMRILQVRERRCNQVQTALAHDNSEKASRTLQAPSKDIRMSDPTSTSAVNEDADRLVLATHIFTCNYPPLQEDASRLLVDLQRYADLRRVKVPDTIFRCELLVPPPSDTPTAIEGLACADRHLSRRLADYLVDRAYEYADEDCTIHRVLCTAGLGAGQRKLPEVLDATKEPVLVLCLGCDARLTVTSTKLGSGGADKVKLEEGTEVSEVQSPASCLSLGMVHGDVLVLKNDVFQLTFKRNGTSILVVGYP